jgi:hypothetical protein
MYKLEIKNPLACYVPEMMFKAVNRWCIDTGIVPQNWADYNSDHEPEIHFRREEDVAMFKLRWFDEINDAGKANTAGGTGIFMNAKGHGSYLYYDGSSVTYSNGRYSAAICPNTAGLIFDPKKGVLGFKPSEPPKSQDGEV